MINNTHKTGRATMTKSEERKRITDLVGKINKIQIELDIKRAAGVKVVNGWVDECAQRDSYSMMKEVNRLAGAKIYG